jgi:predicted sulfurtransferase
VRFGRKLEWHSYVQAETPKEAKRKTKAFMKKNNIKGRIKIGG